MAEPRAVVCYGDSNTWGSDPGTTRRLGRDLRWTTILGRALGPRFDVIAEGLGGRTAGFDDPTLPDRNGTKYLLPCLWSHAPVETVVVMLGTNDLKSYFHASAARIAHEVENLIGMVATNVPGPDGSIPRIMVVAPPPLGRLTPESESWAFAGRVEESKRLAPEFEAIARRNGALFLDAGTIIESSRLDGVHLDADAHRVLGSEIGRLLWR